MAARIAEFSRDFYFLAGFFRVTHDGLSERGTTSVNCNSCERIKKKEKKKGGLRVDQFRFSRIYYVRLAELLEDVRLSPYL